MDCTQVCLCKPRCFSILMCASCNLLSLLTILSHTYIIALVWILLLHVDKQVCESFSAGRLKRSTQGEGTQVGFGTQLLLSFNSGPSVWQGLSHVTYSHVTVFIIDMNWILQKPNGSFKVSALGCFINCKWLCGQQGESVVKPSAQILGEPQTICFISLNLFLPL